MAAPAYWKGYLKLSLVTCAVTLTPATTQSEKVRFHTVNRASGHRVRTQYVDAETGKPVKESDEVKGYEAADGHFVTFADTELESVALESVRTIEIESFVPAGSIGWLWHDTPYYLLPGDKVGAEAFAVIREAMTARKVVGMSRLVLSRRERAVMLEPRDDGIVLWTLRYGDEVRDPADHFSGIGKPSLQPKLVTLVGKLIEERTRPWSADLVRDPVQKQLLSIIAAKQKGGRKPAQKPVKRESGASNVVSLMDALKRSIEKSAPRSR